MSSFGFSPPGSYLPQAEWYPVGETPTGPGAPPERFAGLRAEYSIFFAVCAVNCTKRTYFGLKCHWSGPGRQFRPRFRPFSVRLDYTPYVHVRCKCFFIFGHFFIPCLAAPLSTRKSIQENVNLSSTGRAYRLLKAVSQQPRGLVGQQRDDHSRQKNAGSNGDSVRLMITDGGFQPLFLCLNCGHSHYWPVGLWLLDLQSLHEPAVLLLR